MSEPNQTAVEQKPAGDAKISSVGGEVPVKGLAGASSPALFQMLEPLAGQLAEKLLAGGALSNFPVAAAFKKLTDKPGYTTTEFWFFASLLALANGLAAAGIIHGNAIALMDSITPLAYHLLRNNFKTGQQEKILDLLQNGAPAPPPATAPSSAAPEAE